MKAGHPKDTRITVTVCGLPPRPPRRLLAALGDMAKLASREETVAALFQLPKSRPIRTRIIAHRGYTR